MYIVYSGRNRYILYRAEESDEKRYTQVDGYPVDDGDDHELFAAELGDNR